MAGDKIPTFLEGIKEIGNLVEENSGLEDQHHERLGLLIGSKIFSLPFLRAKDSTVASSETLKALRELRGIAEHQGYDVSQFPGMISGEIDRLESQHKDLVGKLVA